MDIRYMWAIVHVMTFALLTGIFQAGERISLFEMVAGAFFYCLGVACYGAFRVWRGED
jgi:hypothetical protein